MDEENTPEGGRADLSEISEAPHAAVALVSHLDDARALIEDLERQGVPANSIELVGVKTKEPRHDDAGSGVAESDALASLSKSAVAGGAAGILLGGLLGLAMSLLIPDLAWYWGVLIGALFGAGVGGTAGGISVAKYSSPAWDETYQVEEDESVRVAVHNADPDVVDRAMTVMNRHDPTELERYDNLD